MLKLAVGPHGYGPVGDRCEGVYAEEVGTSFFVASLYESFEDFDADVGTPLKLTWSNTVDSAVTIQAVSIKQSFYYRMDTVRPRGSNSYAWPVDKLDSQEMSVQDVGVVGWTSQAVGERSTKVYLPVRIQQSDVLNECGTVTFVIWPGVEPEEVYLSLAPVDREGQRGEFLKKDWPLSHGWYPAQRPIYVMLSDVREAGLYLMTIRATFRVGSPWTDEYYIYHRGLAPECQ